MLLSGRDSVAVRPAHLGEGAQAARLRELRRIWRAIRAHLAGEVPIEQLDLGPDPGSRQATSHATVAHDDAAVDRASDDSFPASDPPSFPATRV